MWKSGRELHSVCPLKIPKPQDLLIKLAEGIEFSKPRLSKAWQQHRNQNFKKILILTELTHTCLLKYERLPWGGASYLQDFKEEWIESCRE